MAAAWLVVAAAGLAARLSSPAWRTDGALVSAAAGVIGLAFSLAAVARSEGLPESERRSVARRGRMLAGALVVLLLALAAVSLLDS